MDSEALKLAVESLDGEFELIRELGRGATAIVYLLRDHTLERDVALKVIRGGLGTEEEAVARLQREAQLVARLQHPNIVKLYGTHRMPDGSFALLMEHVPGRNLKELLVKKGPLPIPTVLGVLRDVASALAYAHRRRIVHRDVKPENIYIDEEVGAARLADFGVARPWDQDSRLTIPGASLGTPAYMSPEQIDGRVVDGRSDVYSLGLVGYEMLLGHHPWEGENVFTTIFKQKNETLSMDLPGLDRFPALSRILEKALQKDANVRWESADAFLAQLKGAAPARRKDDPAPKAPQPRLERGPAPAPSPAPAPGREAAAAVVPGITRPPLEEKKLPPADWATLRTAPSPVPATLQGDPETLAPAAPDRTPLAFPPRTRRRGLWVALAVLLIPGSYLIYQWLGSAIQNPGSGTDLPSGPPGAASSPSANLGPAASLLVLDGGNVQRPVGSNTTLALRATAPEGLPIPDTLVLFQILEGEGTLDPASARTGEGGLAETVLRLPTRVGDVVVRGTISGVPGTEAIFRVSAQPGPPDEITPIVGNGQSAPPGEALPEFIGVRVWDEFGNLIPSAQVRFRILAGDGRILPEQTLTDDVGRAFARWTLGGGLGLQTAAAMVSGPGDTLIVFDAFAEELSVPEPEAEADQADRPLTVALPTPDALPNLLAPPSVEVERAPFVIGGGNVCALRGGSVICRGSVDRGQGGGRSVQGLRALAGGVSHGCGLQRDGTAWCWGANESGQVGDGTTLDRLSAVEVVTESTFSVLVGGLSHTCGLDGAGAASCWGRNLNGQLGNGSRSDRSRPTPVSGGLTFESLASGWNHTCGLTSTGRAYCWGLNGTGQVGDGTRLDRLVPTPVSGTFRSLTAGARHTCGIGRNAVECWGDNGFGQLGNGVLAGGQTVPAPVVGLPSLPTSLALGAVHSCALMGDGSAYCWGQNLHGQLGDLTTENSARPRQVQGALRFISLHAGGGVTCGFLDSGAEYCWGLNQGGQLGDGTRTNRSVPTRVGGG